MSQPAQPQFSLRGAVDLSSLGKPAPAPVEGAAHGGKWVVDVTDTNFQPVVEGSANYLVLLLVWLPSDPTCQQVAAHLSQIADEKDGAFQLARVDAETSPNIARALQAQGVPYVVAVLGGQPVPLFQGTAELDQIRDVVDQVLQAAAANGVTGKAPSDEPVAEDEAPAVADKPLPPLHQEAFDALESGDFAGAVAAYEKALAQDPRDQDAAAGLAQTNLLLRLEGADAAAIRRAAADSPDDVDAQLAVADLDLAGGKVQDALDRLIQRIATVFGDDRDKLRTRLIDYFALLGADDPRVAPARRALAAALY
ncbi:tetratricopeptide repeat protein [Rarobacter faecitabidus]|uniref:Putative thioredoxin n=1 Tax=Rarobacter faecitabidus TaxID=13243 RepID=A0A542ZX30_RARFA|nr:tetratricopeptide repeat protein [Rarobacter faecitabidus]TQL64902.1 putative thioredoxin [Rarobacter faecitabidus]